MFIWFMVEKKNEKKLPFIGMIRIKKQLLTKEKKKKLQVAL